MGFEHLFRDGGTLRLEGYHKTGSGLRPIYRNWKGGIDVFPESNEDRILVYPDRTTSKGIELYHDRKFGSRWSLRGGYALAFVDERVSRIDNVNSPTPIVFDPTHPSPQDQRHAVNLDLTYRPGKTWSINASYAFHTGWPATTESALQVTGPNGQPDVTVTPDKLYGSRPKAASSGSSLRWSTSRITGMYWATITSEPAIRAVESVSSGTWRAGSRFCHHLG